MSQVHGYKCEICGIEDSDHSNWLLVSDQPRAHNIDIIEWDDKLAAQPGICHLCCTDHLQVLVGAWMMPDLGIPPAEATDDRRAKLNTFNMDRACLSSGLETDRESMLAMLDAVEVVLQTSKLDDEEPTTVFDA
ncbi:MAG: hypothetical protein LAN64_05920 [Acidobacteriia bacterium]|nr:hypothetical protein [Terriglobia bacterium]